MNKNKPKSSQSGSSTGTAPTFRLLTNAGTHIFCSAQTAQDRDIWLSSLHSGLEITYAGYNETLTTLKYLRSSSNVKECPKKTTISISPRPPKSLEATTDGRNEEILTPPVPQRTPKRNRKNGSPQRTVSSGAQDPFINPYDLFYKNVSRTHCLSCGRYPPEFAMNSTTLSPLPQYGMENKVMICQPCLVGQGVLRHIMTLCGMYASDAHERVALTKGRDLVGKVVKDAAGLGDMLEEGLEMALDNSDHNDTPMKHTSDSWVNLQMPPEATSSVLSLLQDSEFAACRRRSRTLDTLSHRLESGKMGVPEFQEILHEQAKDAIASHSVQQENIAMKKEALIVAGDMHAALKILREQALSKQHSGNILSSILGTSSSNGADMLSCVLEYFLDLIEQGDLTSIAFFWPQLCQIHMQMLPPSDATALIRVELMEDFLLTVCSKHSVHLSLELVWSCIADLEDSLSNFSAAGAACQRRCYALLRFVCELESVLFDFDGGWGGGSVSLRGMLAPSDDQTILIKEAMGVLQMHRRFSSHHLTRSARLEKLQREAETREGDVDASSTSNEQSQNKLLSDVDAVNHKYKVARNADYFMTQIMISRRLGDIAEKLHSKELHERSESLVDELDALNASGGLGGDLLNKVCMTENGLINVMHIPSTEGHVFRSKERTPVLLLLETIRDESMLSNDEDVEHHQESDTKIQEVDTKGEDGLRNIEDTHQSIGKSQDVKAEITNSIHTKDDVREEIQAMTIDDLKNVHQHVIQNDSFISCQSENSTEECALGNDDTDVFARMDGGKESFASGEMCDIKLNLATETYDPSEDETTNVMEDNTSLPTQRHKDDKVEELIKTASQQSDTIDDNNSQLSKDKQILKDSSDIDTRKKECLGSLSSSVKTFSQNPFNLQSNLSTNGEGRRQVLTSIFLTGMRSSNIIARGIAPVAQKVVQAMDRKRATRLLNGESLSENKFDSDALPEQFLIFPDGEADEEDGNSQQPSEEDECMESLRLLLIQNGVALGKLTPEKAARTLVRSGKDKQEKGDRDDAGNIDPRLGGCGVLSDAVSSAIELWKNGTVNNGELLDLVKKDLEFNRLALPGAENENKLIEDSDFWGRFAFGERWAEKKARIQSSSQFGSRSGWDLTGVIVKSNDDLRQEAFTMQLIELCRQVFEMAGLELWLQPYRILATGKTTGVIEMVRNAMSFDSLKKRPGYQEGGLLGHFKRMSECAVDPDEALKSAKKNFVRSLAAYSLLSYLFLFKDRHNGNILLDTAGHVIHIDFGFILGIAPGGSFSLEQAVPFKMTDEMIEVLGGLKSPLFSEFVTLFCCGFLALQAQTEAFVTIVEITSLGSTFNCFEGKDRNEVVAKLRERFCPDLKREETIAHAMELIRQATTSYGTKQYDYFQYLSQGIAT